MLLSESTLSTILRSANVSVTARGKGFQVARTIRAPRGDATVINELSRDASKSIANNLNTRERPHSLSVDAGEFTFHELSDMHRQVSVQVA